MTIVEVNDLVKTYPSFELKSISFHLECGWITGFIGRNGAGKTTAIKSMLNLIHPDSGTIRYFDSPLFFLPGYPVLCGAFFCVSRIVSEFPDGPGSKRYRVFGPAADCET